MKIRKIYIKYLDNDPDRRIEYWNSIIWTISERLYVDDHNCEYEYDTELIIITIIIIDFNYEYHYLYDCCKL